MSVQALAWVLEHSPTKGAERLCLLAIANHADDRWQAYPSIGTIAREANVSRDTAKRALRSLVDAGHLLRRINGAPDERIPADRRPNLWEIVHDRGGESATPAGGRSTRARGGESAPGGGANRAPQTITEPSEEPVLARAFDAFWREWPSGRRVGKRNAEAAFMRAARRSPVGRIVAGARAHAEAWARAGTETRFIPHPTTWLNRDGWDDPLAKAPTGSAPLHLLDMLDDDWSIGANDGPEGTPGGTIEATGEEVRRAPD